MLRLYVQLRRSEEDPLPPNFKPRASLFKLGSAFGDATIKDIGTFGGKKAKGRGTSTLLMFDVSGNMVQFWDVIRESAMAAIDNMGPDDELGIAFFGGGWVFSGLKSKKNSAELAAWVRQQLPDSAMEWSRKRREKGAHRFRAEFGHGIRWWQKHVDPAIDIQTTKLHYLLQSKALPAIATGTREIKLLIVMSDMVDASGWVDHVGGTRIDGECEPDEGCATIDDVRQRAEETLIPILGIGVMRIDAEQGTAQNRVDLDAFKLLARHSRGEYWETSDLSEVPALLDWFRQGVERLIVADVEFCNLPTRTGFNYLTIKCDDPDAGKRVDSMSHKVDFEELGNSSSCSKPCHPECPSTHPCVGGVCVQAQPGDPICDYCEEWNRESEQCQARACSQVGNEGCGPLCMCYPGSDGSLRCVRGHMDIFYPEVGDSECLVDEHCLGRCDGGTPCICVLEIPDPEQCLLEPDAREGVRVCEEGPQRCSENEFLFEDSRHCGCLECETDRDCEEALSPQYVCNHKAGVGCLCQRKPSMMTKNILVPLAVALLYLVALIASCRWLVLAELSRRRGESAKGRWGTFWVVVVALLLLVGGWAVSSAAGRFESRAGTCIAPASSVEPGEVS